MTYIKKCIWNNYCLLLNGVNTIICIWTEIVLILILKWRILLHKRSVHIARAYHILVFWLVRRCWRIPNRSSEISTFNTHVLDVCHRPDPLKTADCYDTLISSHHTSTSAIKLGNVSFSRRSSIHIFLTLHARCCL